MVKAEPFQGIWWEANNEGKYTLATRQEARSKDEDTIESRQEANRRDGTTLKAMQVAYWEGQTSKVGALDTKDQSTTPLDRHTFLS